IISGNTASSFGGGIYNESSAPVLTNSIISGNTATFYGGGIFNYLSSSSTIVNSLFINNTAPAGEAIFIEQGNVQLVNSTLVGTGNYPVFHEDNGSTWKNSIVWGAVEGSGYSAAYSLIQGNTNTANG